MLWSRRPLQADLLQYAAEDVLQLLPLADKLKAEMGKAELALVSKLSTVYSRWYNASCAPASGFGTLGFASGSWLTQLFDMAKVAPLLRD